MLSLSLYPSERLSLSLSHQCVRKHTGEAAGSSQDTTETRAAAAKRGTSRMSAAENIPKVCVPVLTLEVAKLHQVWKVELELTTSVALKLQNINPFIAAAPIPGSRHTLTP